MSNSQIFQNALLDYVCTLNPKLFPRKTEIFTVSFPEALSYKSILFHTPVPPPSGLILLPSKIMYIPTKMKIITKEEKLKFYLFFSSFIYFIFFKNICLRLVRLCCSALGVISSTEICYGCTQNCGSSNRRISLSSFRPLMGPAFAIWCRVQTVHI